MSVYLDDFDDVYAFYGVSCCAFKLNDTVYEAVEDPSDGYRSALNRVNIVDEETIGLLARYGPFFRCPVAFVRVVQTTHEDMWLFVDAIDGHVWLKIGTDHSDDAYPVFVFTYCPKLEWERP